MNSTYMKACLSAYFRFAKGIKYIATEVGRFSSDFLAIHDNLLIEVEIKTSKADLNNDFKKPKHRIYETGKSEWTPNYFYFAVPKEIAEYAIGKCADKKYGVLVIDGDNAAAHKSQWSSKVRTIKRAKKLTERIPSNKVRYSIIARLSSEMTNLRIHEQLARNEF